MQAGGALGRHPDDIDGRIARHIDVHQGNAVHCGAGEADLGLGAALGGHRDRRGGEREIADADAIEELGAAAVEHVLDLDEVIAGILEGVADPRIGLAAGGVVVESELAHAFGVIEVHVGVDGAADAARLAVEAEVLAGLDGEFVVIALLGEDGTGDGAGYGDFLSGRLGAVVAVADELGQIIDR